MRQHSLVRFAAMLLAAAGAAPLPAATFHDEMLTVGGGQLATAPLPAGPAGTPAAADPRITGIFALPAGKILATAAIATDDPSPFSGRNTLNVLGADGSLSQIAVIPGNDLTASAQVLDMDLDSSGRFYLLIRFPDPLEPSGHYVRLHQVDPSTGQTLSSRDIPNASSIVTAPKGLWILLDGYLRNLDPDSLVVGPQVAHLGTAGNLEADSSGRLYFNRVCSPPCSRLGTFDPELGGAAEEAPPALYEGVPGLTRFTIRRRCYESDTARCLRDGRFRAEVDFTAFDGQSGAARLAPDRSRDTSIFWFFEPNNWELMVKALDGCALNSHYWIYASASTDVGYTMTITDTVTGAQRVYRNPLGQIALTVTDGTAFSCSP